MQHLYTISVILCTLITLVSSSLALPEEKELQLVYFGNTKGVSTHQSHTDLAFASAKDEPLVVVHKGPYAYLCDGLWIVRDEPLTVAEFESALQKLLTLNETANARVLHPSVLTPFELFISLESSTPVRLKSNQTSEGNYGSFALSEDGRTRVFFEHGDAPYDQEQTRERCAHPSDWQIRFAAHLESESTKSKSIALRRPFGDGIARTDQLIQHLTHSKTDTLAVVSAGNNFEAFSFLHPNEPDRQRPNSSKSLIEIGAQVILSGRSEELFSGRGIKAPLSEAGLKPVDSLDSTVLFENEIVVVNLNQMGMDIEAFSESLIRKIRGIRAQRETKNSLIIGMGVLSADMERQLLKAAVPLDLLITNFENSPHSRQTMTYELLLPSRKPLSMLPVGEAAWGLISLRRKGNKVVVKQEVYPIFDRKIESSRAQTLRRSVNQTRQAAFKNYQTEFIHELPKNFTSPENWRILAARALKESLHADVGLLSTFPVTWSIHNPVLKLNAIANLPISEKAQLVSANGKTILKGIEVGIFKDKVIHGLDLRSKKIGGRPISERRWYLLATTNDLAQTLKTAYPDVDLLIDLKNSDQELDAYAQTKILRWLPVLASEHAVSEPKRAPEWYLDFNQIALEGGRLHRSGNPSQYGDVAEPRLSTKEYQQIGLRGRVTFGYDSDAFTHENFVDWAFSKAYLQDAPAQETEDRLDMGTEFILNGVGFFNQTAHPFFRTAYLTEFTAAELDGMDNRKSRGETVAGALFKWSKQKMIRLGVSAAVDFNIEPLRPWFGTYSQFDIGHRIFGLNTYARGELRFLPSMIQTLDSSQLEFYGDAEVGLLIPIWRRLSIRSYVGGFYYRAPDAFQRSPGLNVRGGLALHLDHFLPL